MERYEVLLLKIEAELTCDNIISRILFKIGLNGNGIE